MHKVLLSFLTLSLALGAAGCSGGGGSSRGGSASTTASTTAATQTASNTTPTTNTPPASSTIPLEVPLDVTATSLVVYQGPSTAQPAVGTANAGEAYVHLEQQGTWHKVQFGSVVGWVEGAGIAQSSTKTAQRVTATSLNVRSGPGTNFRQVGTLAKDAWVAVSQSNGDWREISYDGQLAWVHGAYLQGSGVSAPSARPTSAAGFVQLAANGDGFDTYSSPGERWGLPQLIYGVERAGVAWKQTGNARMGVGHISKENGGAFPPHSSHRYGKNLDVRPMKTSGEGPVTIFQSAYSRSRTQALIDLLKAETNAQSVLFNDRNVSGVRYYSGHDNHFHLSIP